MSNMTKFWTLPVSALCALILFSTFVMYTNSQNKLDPDHKFWNVMSKNEEERQTPRFEPRKCNSKLDPFGNRCKQLGE